MPDPKPDDVDFHEETTDPLVADLHNFYKVEKWTRDGTKVDSLLYAGNSLGRARSVFEHAIKHRLRIRLTIRQRTRVLDQWPPPQRRTQRPSKPYYAALRRLTSATARPVFPFAATAALVANAVAMTGPRHGDQERRHNSEIGDGPCKSAEATKFWMTVMQGNDPRHLWFTLARTHATERAYRGAHCLPS